MEEHPITSVIKFFLLSLLALMVLVGSGLLYRTYEQNRVEKSTQITSTGGIDMLGHLVLGGMEQWMLIRGQQQTNPVLLYLHGGPGSFVIPRVRDFGQRLEEDFVVVYWDQRGSGKSYGTGMDASKMNLQQFVDDTSELVGVLKRRFNVDKIYLAGNSWGAALGAYVVQRQPESFYAFVGTGVLVNTHQADSLSYRFTLSEAQASGNDEAYDELSALGEPPWDYDAMYKQRKWLRRFGGTIYAEKETNGSFLSDFMGKMLVSPEYSLLEIIENSYDPNFALRNLWDDVGQIDLMTQVPELDVPVYFIAGRHDYNTPGQLAEAYLDSLQAPSKRMIWFENTAHIPELENPERFYRVMRNTVLAETYPE